MLCYRCGSHVADGAPDCGNCGQAFSAVGLDKKKLTGSFEVLKRRQGAAAQERGRREHTPGAGVLSPEFAAKRLRTGDLVSGRYEIRSVVGRGPAGTVYRALDQEIDDDVALKVIRPDVLESDDDKERFVRVLRKARRLSQQNIVRVYDVEWDKEEDRVFYTSQYLEGLTLRKVLDLRRDRGQHFELREVEPIVSQVCLALQHAHKGAVHGGLKPDNIVILPDLLKITDFYLAEALGPDLFLRLQDEAEVGDYMAPEVRVGGTADARSDLFSLGAMLTEMLCGVPMLEEGAAPSSLNPALSPAEDELHSRATAADPDLRYRNAEEFSEDVTSVIDTGGVLRGEDLGEGAAIAGGAAVSLQLEGGTLLDDSDPSTGYTDPHVVIEDIQPVDPNAELTDDDDTPPGAVLFDDSARRKLADHEGSPEERAKMHRVVPTQEMMHLAGERPPDDDRDELPLLPLVMLIVVVVLALAYGAIELLKGRPETAGKVVSVTQPVGPGTAAAPAPRAPEAATKGVADAGAGEVDDKARDAGEASASADAGVDAGAPDAGLAAAPDAGTPDAGVPGPDAGVKLASVAPAAAAATPSTTPGRALPPTGPQTALEPLQIPPAPPEPTAAPAATAKAAPAPTPPPPPKPAPVVAPQPPPPPKPVPPPPPITIPAPRPVQPTPPAPPVRPTPPPVRPTPPPQPAATVVAKAQPAPPPAPPKAKLTKCPGGMAKIKKGKAKIGSSKRDGYRGFEGVEQRVEVDAYCIDRYEYPGRGRAPMTGITYKQAEALCGARKLRLCTDREWERACKGPRGYRYPYGGTFNADRCVTEDKSENPRALQASGSFKRCKSGYGVYDMSGNAAEWSAEGHLRGGTATKPDYAVRCAHKVKKNRAAKDPFVGFRCCADAQ